MHLGVGSAPNAGGCFLSPLPKASAPVCLQVSLVHSAPPLPVIYYLWLSPLVAHPVARTQQSGLSTKGSGQRLSWGQGFVSPQATAAQRGVVCLSTKAAAICGMTQQQDPGGYSQFSPQGFHPQPLLRRLQPTLPLPLPKPWVSGCK